MKLFSALCFLAFLGESTVLSFEPGENNSCNSGLAGKSCSDWSSKVSNTGNRVTIGCGECVEITSSLDVTLSKGIDIIGRLRIAPPQGSKVIIKTPFVLVQGILSIDTPYAPETEETVQFVMTSGPVLNENGFGVNSGKTISVGQRPIVVAGGRLDVNGLPSDCKTWVHLDKVTEGTATTLNSETIPKFVLPSESCNLGILSQTFDSIESNWFGYNLAHWYLRNDGDTRGSYMETTNRHLTWQGAGFSLDDSFMDCVQTDTLYLVTLYMRLKTASGTNKCTTSNEKCPSISMTRKLTTSDSDVRQRMVSATRGNIQTDGDWYPVTGSVTFADGDLTTTPYTRYIYVEGADVGTDIAIDNFEIKRLGSQYFPQNCDEILINGKAELDAIHPYPFYAGDKWRGALVIEKESNGNQFFRVKGRLYSWATIRYPIKQLDCFSQGATYELRVKMKASKSLRIQTRFVYYTKEGDTNKFNGLVAGDCQTGTTTWSECVGQFSINDANVWNSHDIFVDANVIGDTTTDIDFDDFSLVQISAAGGSFVVPSAGVASCWTSGSKVLLTSETQYFEDTTMATIKDVSDLGNGQAAISFVEPLSPRSSKADGDFPIELALMERNIKFKSDSDVYNEGGHVMILATSSVKQRLDGVELFKFGQRGTLGRYPIHFHLCDGVPGSVVTRNLIHMSNQRCVVVHGSHNLTIQENVAFSTFGHCFMLEDGGEIGNKFIGNLAVSQFNTESNLLVRSGESDTHSSSYWCTNPLNTWESNVAAGGEGSGFWFELEREVKAPSVAVVEGPMFELPLTKFNNNVAHSYRSNGLRSYPDGYRPKETATFENTKSYKNHQNGVFFHNSWNLKIRGGIFADNRRGIQIHRADNVTVEDVTVLGRTDSMVQGLNRAERSDNCHSSNRISGIAFHSFLFRDSNPRGATLRDVTFKNLTSALTGCSNAAALRIHDDEVESHFDSWTDFGQMMFENVDEKFTMCGAVEKGVNNVIIEVSDGSVFGSPGFIVSSGQTDLTNFLTSSCNSIPGACADFCPNACLRVVRFLVEPTVSQNMKLRVESGSKTIEVSHSGVTDSDTTKTSSKRVFTAHLPPGTYTVSFVEGGTQTWPTFVEEDLKEAPSCWGSQTLSYTLTRPEPPSQFCDTYFSNTFRNGDFETGSLDFWQHHGSGIDLIPGVAGQGSHTAQARKIGSNHFGQHLDTRCVKFGEEIEFQASARSLDSNGNFVNCDPNSNSKSDRCPYATMYGEYINSTTGVLQQKWERVGATLVSTNNNAEWKTIHGVYKFSAHMGRSTRVFFYVEGGPGRVQLDNAALTRFDRNGKPLVLGGDFETGDNRYWPRGSNDPLAMSTPGVDGSSTALMTAKIYGSFFQYISPLTDGSRYLMSARFKLDGDTTCENKWTDNSCPKFILYSSFAADNGGDLNEWKGYFFASHPIIPGGWNTMWGYIEATEKQSTAEYLRMQIGQGPKTSNIVIDDVSLVEVQRDCSELVANGQGQYGDARGWDVWRRGSISAGEDSEGDIYVNVNGRENSWEGLAQLLDSTCVVDGATYQVKAQMKMTRDDDGTAHGCDPTKTGGAEACPYIGFQGYHPVDKSTTYIRTVNATNTGTWVADDWNTYIAEVTFNSDLASFPDVRLYIERPPGGIAISIKHISVSKV